MVQRTRFARAAIALLLVLLLPSIVAAQGLTSTPAQPEDVESIDAIVDAFYDVISHGAGEPIDWARDSTLYLADLRFKIAVPVDDGYRVRIVDHAEFAATSGDASEGFFERETHRVTQRWGPMAQVFSTYEWRTTEAGPVGGRGINAIELLFDGERWWISSAMWMQADEDHPIPAEYLRE